MKRSAFTLLELLAASALATLLILVMLQVIASLGRTRAAMERQAARDTAAAHAAWRSDLLDTLRRDLAAATNVAFERGRITVTGNASLDPATLAAGDEAVVVVYELDRRGAGRSCLVRRQIASTSWTELLCADVTHFAAESLAVSQTDRAQVVRVHLAAASGAVLDEVIVAR